MTEEQRIIEPRPVSGFPEYLPEEEAEFRALLDVIRKGFERFGFTPIETPAAEPLEILASKGEINKEIYGLSRPNAPEGERDTDMALHFDLTVPLARYVALNFSRLDFPFRRYQIQKVWRGERPQKGRFREFYQCDIDIVGHESLDPLNDAEIPAVIYGIFHRMGVGGFVIRMSNRKVMQGFLAARGISPDRTGEILRAIDKLPKIGRDAVLHELADTLGQGQTGAGEILELAGLCGRGADVAAVLQAMPCDHPLFRAGAEELEMLSAHLGALGVPPDAYEFDISITRGLDYYTGTVYETFLKNHPELGSVCSGGRYDNLASYFTNQRLPGVGISIGLTRLFSFLLAAGDLKPRRKCPTQVLVTVMDRSRLSDYFSVATLLRDAGIPTEVYLEDRKIRQQFKYADKKGIPLALVAGETEFAGGFWQLKDLREGRQEEVVPERLAESIRTRLEIKD